MIGKSQSEKVHMSETIYLSEHHISVAAIMRNIAPAKLYEQALRHEKGSAISDQGALVVSSGKKTGRSPGDKRIVDDPQTTGDIWWGSINIKLQEHTFMINHERAIDYLNTCEQLYVVDGFAGWDPQYRLKIRVICTRAYHALFMHNMLIRPSEVELAAFGEPDFTIYNAGRFPANRYTSEMTSRTSIDLSFERREMVILGTEYAGEMKKGVFTVMNFLMPKAGLLSMHCSANAGEAGDVALFFGLSGTGKTTLSADPRRRLIGDDEHVWSGEGVFNIEGGCYAKCIDLTEEKEPEIYRAIRFGTVLENVVYDEDRRVVDYESDAITENTRAAYPIEYIPNAEIPCIGGHPRNIVFLTCDAFGVLPPVSRLTPDQAMYHFISGYTAKVAGTEMGVTEPEATFSACFGAAFMVLGDAEGNTFVEGLCALARHRSGWIRPLEDWRPESHNARRQFGSLARHFLARYAGVAVVTGIDSLGKVDDDQLALPVEHVVGREVAVNTVAREHEPHVVDQFSKSGRASSRLRRTSLSIGAGPSSSPKYSMSTTLPSCFMGRGTSGPAACSFSRTSNS
jgi:phosphoenolpyruvate carboxykinase (ATP)